MLCWVQSIEQSFFLTRTPMGYSVKRVLHWVGQILPPPPSVHNEHNKLYKHNEPNDHDEHSVQNEMY